MTCVAMTTIAVFRKLKPRDTEKIIDAKGRVVPTAMNLVTFSVTGAGVNAGVGNGDPASHELNVADTRTVFYGLCMVLVKAGVKAGTIKLTATADGLKSAVPMLFKVG